MKKILLTGGNGMVGRTILDHQKNSCWEFLSPRSSVLDLTDFSATLDYVAEAKPDYIIHAAGRVGGIHANVSHPVDFLVTNLDIGRNIILAAKQAGVKRLLNLGSSCMYPRNAPNPLMEEMILQGELEPTNEGYALAKVVALRLCEYINKETPDLEYKTMIPCNIYGGFDKFDPEHSHLIPAILHKLHTAKSNADAAVEIWGDGNARREFMYADDLADAIYFALEHFEEVPSSLNIGVGADHTINEYYQVAAEVVGYSGEFKHNLDMPVGMQQKLVSVERQTRLGWLPKTSLREGIQITYDYYLQEVVS